MKIRISPYLFILSIIATATLTSFVAIRIDKSYSQSSTATTTPSSDLPVCNYHLTRLAGYDYVSPLLYAEPECESGNLGSIKGDIQNVIEQFTTSGELMSASVYLRKFNSGEWMSIGDADKYSPGSLLKVPIMISCLKMNEQHPGFMDKKIPYTKYLGDPRHPVFVSNSIKPGNSYTVKELLKYIITYSDNQATYLLYLQIDKSLYAKVFTDLGMVAPKEDDLLATISAREYSKFMKVLYDASYLNITDSEYCLELLSTCNFNDGLVAGLPAHTKVAHKFGEGGTNIEQTFCESAIVFGKSGPYLLTVMTKGKDVAKLPAIATRISALAYQKVGA